MLSETHRFQQVNKFNSNYHTCISNNAKESDFSFLSCKTLSNIPAKQTAVVPVFNIPREDFCLRTEAVFLFKQFHLDLGFFTFIEDIELETLMETKKLKLTLVDHNVLAQAQKYLETAVIEILGECVSNICPLQTGLENSLLASVCFEWLVVLMVSLLYHAYDYLAYVHNCIPATCRASGADLGGQCRGCASPVPRDDLWLSNTTGILQKNLLYCLICILSSSHYVIA